REDRPEDDKGNAGCDGHDASPFRGWIVSSGSESGGVTRGRQARRDAVSGGGAASGLSLVISLVPEISPVLEVVENLLLLGVDGRREGLDGAVDRDRRRAQRGVGGSRCGWPGRCGSGSRGRRPGR